eukprot:gene6758-biopygen4445
MTSLTDTVSSDLFEVDLANHSTQDELCISRFEVVLPQSPSSRPSVSLGIEDVQASGGDQTSGQWPQYTGSDDSKSYAQADDGLQRRKRKRRRRSVFITISHKHSTGLEDVGLQLWRGALLLADYLLSRGEAYWRGRTAVELGAGVGFLGVLLSLVPCRRVFLTDIFASMAQLMEKNLSTNDHVRLYCCSQNPVAEVRTR